jgi:VanZ family protein
MHLHFIVWAAQGMNDDGGYTDVVYVEVIAVDLDAAIERARRFCPGRRYYRVNNIIEHHDHASHQDD